MPSVYALVDPRDETVHYIGVSKNPARRFVEHLHPRQRNKAKQEWIQELLASQILPKLAILEDVSADCNIYERECYWTLYYANNGHPLTNLECTRVWCRTSKEFPTRAHVLEAWRKKHALHPEF